MVSEAKKKRDAAKKIKAAAKVTGKSAQEVSDSISANTVCPRVGLRLRDKHK